MALKKVERGQRVTSENLSAEFINRTIDLIQQSMSRGPAPTRGLDPGIIRIQNNSGGDVDRNEVLIATDPVITPDDNLPEFLNNWALVCEQSSAANTLLAEVHQMVITVEPIPDTKYGRARIAGVMPVEIDVSNAAHGFASPKAGTYILKSEPAGGLPIVWKQPGTGTKKAIVRFGSGGGGGDHHYLATDGIPAASKDSGSGSILLGSAMCERYHLDPETWTLTLSGETELVYNSMPGEIESGKTVNTQLEKGLPIVIVDPCDDYVLGGGFTGGYDEGFD